MELRPYQQEAKDAIFTQWETVDRTLLVLPTGCHEPDQLILMADGSTKRAADIKTGDRLMGDDGRPRNVLMLHHGVSEMYNVLPVKGDSFTVTGDHLLPLVRTNEKSRPVYPSQKLGGKIDCVTVEEYLLQSKWYRHIHKLFRSKLIESFEGNDGNGVTVDPYFLGVILGDGNVKNGAVSITTPDPEIMEMIHEIAHQYGASLRSEPAGKAKSFFITGSQKLRRELKDLRVLGSGSYNKKVPNAYKTAPVKIRMEVLAGLMDTDGSLSNNEYDFVTASVDLAEDVAFMARSIGLAAYVSGCFKSCQTGAVGNYWRITISGEINRIPCRVARKKARQRMQKKDVLRTGIKKITPAGIGEYFGFTVDGNNRYLLDDFTVTHNCGKTIVFAKVAEDCVRMGRRVLILAHRGELLDQAADKLQKATGLGCAVEKAEQSCKGSWFRVVVGSVQTLMGDRRLSGFPEDYFTTIIVDEAHHSISDSYQKVLQHFQGAKVLGVTATPDRSDMRNLGQYFESLAYEYTLPKAIKEGYLSPIKAMTIPLKLDISQVGISAGDFKASDIGTALDPYLYQIAHEMAQYCKGRKTVVFLPLIATSQKFRDILEENGFRAGEVNGSSEDRAEVLADFDAGKYDVLCNSMLLTEGWDCPTVDCIVVLRPTKSRSLYCLDEETEVLTHDGWKAYAEIGEEVLSFDKRTGETRFVPVLETIRRPLYDDEFFCSLNGPSSNIRVTNGHRMIYDNKRHKGWKIKTAEELANTRDGAYIPVAGHGQFPGVPLTDDELRFIGWVMTDGSINKANNAIVITQEAHQPWLEKIQECIDGCGFKYNRFERFADTGFDRKSPAVCWTISKGIPRGRDKHLRGWGALEKYLSKDMSTALFDMTEEQFDIMLEAVNLGDGHKQTNQSWIQRSYHISKGNKTFIERLQMMAIQRGWRANITEDTVTNHTPLYTIHMKKQNFIKVGSFAEKHTAWRKEPHSDEKCWCVQTELGTIVTRRKGKVAIVGNCQMVGRGTRLAPGKDHLLLLDFLWMTERHELCRPASLICKDEEVAKKMTKNLEDDAGHAIDLEEAEEKASGDIVAEREEALAKQLAEMRKRKKKLVDPLQFEMSIQAEDLTGYVPAFGWEMAPPSDRQKENLEKLGILPDEIDNAGKAAMLLDRLAKRRQEGLTTPKQIRFLEGRGFQHVGTWQFDQARILIDRIAGNGWKVPYDINPQTYKPAHIDPMENPYLGW